MFQILFPVNLNPVIGNFSSVSQFTLWISWIIYLDYSVQIILGENCSPRAENRHTALRISEKMNSWHTKILKISWAKVWSLNFLSHLLIFQKYIFLNFQKWKLRLSIFITICVIFEKYTFLMMFVFFSCTCK